MANILSGPSQLLSEASLRLRRLAKSTGDFLNEPVGQLLARKNPLAVVGCGAMLAAVLLAVVAVLAMLVSWANVALASRPASCALCHEIQPAYDQWATSTHKGIGCLNCHAEPGLAGYLKINTSAVVNTFQHAIGGYEAPIEARVEDSSCLKCHPRSERPEVLPQASLRIAHSKHEEQRCADCHGRLVHTVVQEASVQAIAKSHVPQDCQVCHPSPKPTYVHGDANLACTSCHSATIPNHDLAMVRGAFPREGCLECHNRLRVVGSPEECEKCHTSPHGIDVNCRQCHSSTATWGERSFQHPVPLLGRHAQIQCSQCHTGEKGFTSTELDCANCHTPPEKHFGNQCSQCHRVGQKWK